LEIVVLKERKKSRLSSAARNKNKKEFLGLSIGLSTKNKSIKCSILPSTAECIQTIESLEILRDNKNNNNIYIKS
jgi:hypothetical protein